MTITLTFVDSAEPDRILASIVQIREGRDDQITMVDAKGNIHTFDREAVQRIEITPVP